MQPHDARPAGVGPGKFGNAAFAMYRFFLSFPTPKAPDDGPSSPPPVSRISLVPSGVTRTTVWAKVGHAVQVSLHVEGEVVEPERRRAHGRDRPTHSL